MRGKRTSWILRLGAAVLLASSLGYGFWSYVRMGMTRVDYHLEITQNGISTEFSDAKSLKRVHQANRATDAGTEFSVHGLHFDSEAFSEGTQLLAENLNQAVDHLASCDKSAAIVRIGRGLHALQDFYSHSNWVENHLENPFTIVPTDIPICALLVTLDQDGRFAPGPLAADPSFQDTCTPARKPSGLRRTRPTGVERYSSALHAV